MLYEVITSFIKIGSEYADKVTKGSPAIDDSVVEVLSSYGEKLTETEPEGEEYAESYYDIYTGLAE